MNEVSHMKTSCLVHRMIWKASLWYTFSFDIWRANHRKCMHSIRSEPQQVQSDRRCTHQVQATVSAKTPAKHSTVGAHMECTQQWCYMYALDKAFLGPSFYSRKSRDWCLLMYSTDSHLVAHGGVSDALPSEYCEGTPSLTYSWAKWWLWLPYLSPL